MGLFPTLISLTCKALPCERWVYVQAAEFHNVLKSLDDHGVVMSAGVAQCGWQLRSVGGQALGNVRRWRSWEPDRDRVGLCFWDSDSTKVKVQPEVEWVAAMWRKALGHAAKLRLCKSTSCGGLCAADACAANSASWSSAMCLFFGLQGCLNA